MNAHPVLAAQNFFILSTWWEDDAPGNLAMLPICVLVGSGIIFTIWTVMCWGWLKRIFIGRRAVRLTIQIIPFVLGFLVLPAVWDRSGLTAILNAHFSRQDVFGLSILAFTGADLVWSQIVTYILQDNAIEDASLNRGLIERVKEDAKFKLGIARAFLKVVTIKSDRVHQAVLKKKANEKTNLSLLRSVLSPSDQRDGLIKAVHDLLNPRVGTGHTLCVHLFKLNGAYLEPVVRCDGQVRRGPSSSFANIREHFKVTAVNLGSVAAWVSSRGQMLFIADANEAHLNPQSPFQRFGTREAEKIESMVGVPIMSTSESLPVEYVMTIHTDKLKFFTDCEVGRTELALLVENVRERLLFEDAMDKLLTNPLKMTVPDATDA